MLTRRQFGIGAAALISAPYIRPAKAASNTVRIGMIQPFSGSYAAYATEGQPAFDYIIKKINESGGIKSLGGAKIEVVKADDSSMPARTAAEARRLAANENVSLIAGTLLSAQMLAISPVLDELEMPTLSLWAGGARSKWMYSCGFSYDRGYARSMADMVIWLRDQKGFDLKTVVPAYSNYEAGQQVNIALVKYLKDAGFQIVGETPLDIKAQDQTAAMIRIRSLKPDLVTGLVTPRDGMLLHQARYNLNYHGTLFVGGTGGYADTSLWNDMGPDVCKSVLTKNLFAMTGFSNGLQNPAIQSIITELHDKAGMHTVGQSAIQGAQSARVIQRVLEAAGATDKASIMEGFRKMEIPAGDPDLYVAKANGLKFGEDRMYADASAIFIQWGEDRSQQVVFPKQFASTEPRPRV